LLGINSHILHSNRTVSSVQHQLTLPPMVGTATIRCSLSQIAFPMTFNVRTAKPSQSDERAQDTIDEAAAGSNHAVRAAHRTCVQA
jgi:hypothetical protein